jgi:hypothetical protein
MARAESERKSQRSLMDLEHKRETGALHGRAPYGYTIEGVKDAKRLVPTAEGRKYVPLIFQAVIDGKSLRDVAAWLTAEGVKTSAGNAKWHEGFIGNRLIKNPTYYGARPNGGTLETQALVSVTTWQQANASLASRVRPGRGTVEHAKPLVAPLCGNCYGESREGSESGISPMYRVFTGKAPNRVAYFRCTGHGPQRKGCGAPMVAVADMESAVKAAMAQRTETHSESVFIAGDDRSDEIARLREAAMDAYRRGDKTRFVECDSEADRLAALPSIPPRWDTVETGQSEAAYFASLDHDAQREYLASWNVVALQTPSAAFGGSDRDFVALLTPRPVTEQDERTIDPDMASLIQTTLHTLAAAIAHAARR